MRLTHPKSVSVLAALLIGTGAVLTGPLAAGVSASPEIRLAAADDTYTSSLRPAIMFGALDKLAVGRLDGDQKVSYLKFVVPAGAKVESAKLKLQTIGGLAGGVTLSRVQSNDWTEAELTAAKAPPTGAVIATAKAAPLALQVILDVSAAVTGPGTYSFALQSPSGAISRFRSAESSNGRPELTVSLAAEVAVAKALPPAKAVKECVTGALLVPSCGVLWGGAAGGFTDVPRDIALADWEKLSGRTSRIFHQYHKGDEQFPTAAEIAMSRDASHQRVLMLNWKIAYGSSWAKVAKGEQDKRIDAFAARIKSTYPEKFFLVLNHEPENDVIAKAGSGWEAKDFAAMYRYTILRLRAKGVTNAVNVMAYMGNEKWMAQSWWKDIYPGDDVVDWIGLDSYVSAEKGYYHYGMFADLLDRKAPKGLGFYEWATTKHKGKPLMIAEWGVYHRIGKTADKTPGYNSVLPELAKRPAIKALVHFDTPHDDEGDRDISINSSTAGLTAFRKLAVNPIFDVKLKK